MPLGMKSHISIQLGSSLNLTSRSFFSFSSTTDAILESWKSAPVRTLLCWAKFEAQQKAFPHSSSGFSPLWMIWCRKRDECFPDTNIFLLLIILQLESKLSLVGLGYHCTTVSMATYCFLSVMDATHKLLASRSREKTWGGSHPLHCSIF